MTMAAADPLASRSVTTDDNLEEGGTINQYVVENKLGEGSFGLVVRVLDTTTNRRFVRPLRTHTRLALVFSFSRQYVGNEGHQQGPGQEEDERRRHARHETAAGGSGTVFASLLFCSRAATFGTQAPKQADPMDVFRKEVAILKKLEHPHIIRIVEVLNSSETDYLYMGMRSFSISVPALTEIASL